MTIMEYGPRNPHPEGFIGIRISVKKIGGDEFQEYFNFKGLCKSDRDLLRAKAERINSREVKDQELRKKSYLVNAPSKSPLSPVLGVMVGLNSRNEPSGGFRYELTISVSGADSEIERAGDGTIFKETKSWNIYDYEWFVASMKRALKARAVAIGYKRTPSQWISGIPSDDAVDRFVNAKIRKKIAQARLSRR